MYHPVVTYTMGQMNVSVSTKCDNPSAIKYHLVTKVDDYNVFVIIYILKISVKHLKSLYCKYFSFSKASNLNEVRGKSRLFNFDCKYVI